MRNRLLEWAGAVLFGVSFALPCTAAQDVESHLKAVAGRLNQSLPRVVDSETRADKVTVEPGPKFLYHFTLLSGNNGEPARRLSSGSLASELKTKICSAPEMRPMLSTGATLGYIYSAGDGSNVGAVYVSPRECGL